MRRAAAFLAAVCLLAAAVLVIRAGHVGRGAVLLGLCGAALAAAAALGSRTPAAYRGLALVLLNTAVLLALLELAATALLKVVPPPAARADAPRILRGWSPAFGEEHWRATAALRYEPYTIWRNAEFRGRYLNVGSDHLRRTTGVDCRPGVFTVFVFGGSTVWGWGTADSATIPSRLAAELTARTGEPVCVVNYGQLGYITTQQLIELERQLQRGHAPDLVIFYDGSNDCLETFKNHEAGVHKFRDLIAGRVYQDTLRHPVRELIAATAAWRLLLRLRPPPPEPPVVPADSVPVLAEAAAATLLANNRILAGLARDFGFRRATMLQPRVGVGGKRLTAAEQAFQRIDAAQNLCRSMYQRVRAALAADPHGFDLSGIFDTVSATMYVDPVHITPAGNAMVARRMAELLEVPHGRPAR